MLSRRAFLLSASASALAAAMPVPAMSAAAPVTVGVDIATKPDMVAFVVGTPGEYDWMQVFAGTADEAIKAWLDDRGYAADDEYQPDIEAARIPEWDGRAPGSIKPADWLRVGWGHICDRCGYEASPDGGARAVGDDVVCEECLTLADRIAIDPDDVVEDLANRIADEGEAGARDWVARQGVEVQADLWRRAVAEASN